MRLAAARIYRGMGAFVNGGNIPPGTSKFRITENSNNRITEDGNTRITEQ